MIADKTTWDGRPPNPERDGWHWLREPASYAEPEPVKWCADPGVWRGKGSAKDAARMGVIYLGECKLP